MDYFAGNEQSRFSQLSQQPSPYQRNQLQNVLHPSDGMNQSYPNNLSKFFDFHKNQQQQQQQQLFYSDQLNMPNVMDQSRLMDARRPNPQYIDQSNTQNSEFNKLLARSNCDLIRFFQFVIKICLDHKYISNV